MPSTCSSALSRVGVDVSGSEAGIYTPGTFGGGGGAEPNAGGDGALARGPRDSIFARDQTSESPWVFEKDGVETLSSTSHLCGEHIHNLGQPLNARPTMDSY